MSLDEIQKAFYRAVRFDPTPTDALRHFAGDTRLNAESRIGIYRSMYWFRQVSALAESFPRLRERLGEEHFTKLACRYLRRYPSRHGTLEHLGASLPRFMIDDTPEQSSLARLEWARNLALLAPDAARVGSMGEAVPATFARARLRFAPSLALVESDGDALCAFDATWPRSTTPVPVAVFRKGFNVRHLAVPECEARALSKALAGAKVEEVLCDFTTDASSTHQAFEMLRGWLSRKWIETIE